MWLPKTCFECWFTYLWYAASPRMAAPQLAQLQSRDDGHREAPAAHGLTAQPRPEEAGERAVHERDDAADAGHALDAREQRAADSCFCPRRLRSPSVTLSLLRSGGSTPGGAQSCTTARQDPVGDDDAAKHSANHGIRGVGRAAADHRHADGGRDSGQRRLRDPGQVASNGFSGASETVSYRVGGPRHRLGSLTEGAERLWHRAEDEDDNAADKDTRHVRQHRLQNLINWLANARFRQKGPQ